MAEIRLVRYGQTAIVHDHLMVTAGAIAVIAVVSRIKGSLHGRKGAVALSFYVHF